MSSSPAASPELADYNKNELRRRRPSSPSQLAPKKRFKLEALLDLEKAAAAEAEASTRLQPQETSVAGEAAAPFRPWAAADIAAPALRVPEHYLMMLHQLGSCAVVEPVQEEPLALVVDKNQSNVIKIEPAEPVHSPSLPVLASVMLQSRSSKGSKSVNEVRKQTNYKSLTKDRRVEANARERQRVHTITAAFENLQAAIPSEDENPKLSKLSVIKIATAYIMALSRMAGYDYTEDQSAPSLETVVQHCQEVIHTETRIKKRSS
jgi:hypothetical protein